VRFSISADFIANENLQWEPALAENYGALQRQLDHRNIDIEAITAKATRFAVAVPTWGVGTGGTRFARFPGPGEPRTIFDKLEDCAVIYQLSRITPAVSPHFPRDKVSD
jgi:L-rhamnose isomerase/sugar isomerase